MAFPVSSFNVAGEQSSSEYVPQQVSLMSSNSQVVGLKDSCSPYDVYAFTCLELDEVASKLNCLVGQYSKHIRNCKTTRSRSFSKSDNDEYSDILNRKGYLCNKLTEAVENSKPHGIPKYRSNGHHEFSSMLTHHYNEVNGKVQQQTEELKKAENDSERLNMYISRFASEEEIYGNQESEDSVHSRRIFQEAKKDMATVMKACVADGEEMDNIMSSLKILTDAYMANLDNIEEQYVEIPIQALKHKAMQRLMRGGVIIPHPVSSGLFRFCVE